MDHDCALPPGQLVAERGHLGRAGQVIELERRAAGGLQMADHRQDRRDADAAGDEDMARRAVLERESIARRRDRQQIAGPDPVDQAGRAAAALVLALDRDHIAMPVGRVVRQGIAADRTAGRLHAQVGAGPETRQRAAVRARQVVLVDIGRDPGGAQDLERHHRVIVGLDHDLDL